MTTLNSPKLSIKVPYSEFALHQTLPGGVGAEMFSHPTQWPAQADSTLPTDLLIFGHT